LGAQRGQSLWGGFHAGHDLYGVASEKFEKEKNQQYDTQHGGDHLPKSSEDVRSHDFGDMGEMPMDFRMGAIMLAASSSSYWCLRL
jgi:hypothetical protein